MRGPRIEVLIDELIVDGAQVAAPEQLGPALHDELARLLHGGTDAAGPAPRAALSVTAQIARAVYDRIGRAQEPTPRVTQNKESR